MVHIVEHSLLPNAVDIEWPYTRFAPHLLADPKRRLRERLRQAEDERWSWLQEDVIQWLIKPILVELGFYEHDMHRRVPSIPGSRHKADMLVRNSFHEFCVIEAKKIDADLFKPEFSESFHGLIDQGLRYFEVSTAPRCIVTNGVDWCLFNRSRSLDYDYTGVLFKLDLEISQYDHRFPDFVGLFHFQSIVNPPGRLPLPCHCILEVLHKTGSREASRVLLHDATEKIGQREARYRSMDYRDPFAPSWRAG